MTGTYLPAESVSAVPETAAVSAGIPIEKAVAAATANPARSIGIYDKVGSITPGKRADLLLTTPDLTLRAVL